MAAFLETLSSVVPLTIILLLIQLVILRAPLADIKKFTVGFIFTVIGLHIFLIGIEWSLIPLSKSVGENFVTLKWKWIILVIGFGVGYAATAVEPGLQTLANQVVELSEGAIPYKTLITGVAIGVGSGVALGLAKILFNIPYNYIVIPLLLIISVLTVFAPEPFNSIAFDAASATTGPVNIPINMALAIGLATVIEGVDPLLAGFGIVGLTSIGTMVSVLVLGIISKF
ncbi:MAG: DUF1538 domain-containing protein [Treponemataceae bacterium]